MWCHVHFLWEKWDTSSGKNPKKYSRKHLFSDCFREVLQGSFEKRYGFLRRFSNENVRSWPDSAAKQVLTLLSFLGSSSVHFRISRHTWVLWRQEAKRFTCSFLTNKRGRAPSSATHRRWTSTSRRERALKPHPKSVAEYHAGMDTGARTTCERATAKNAFKQAASKVPSHPQTSPPIPNPPPPPPSPVWMQTCASNSHANLFCDTLVQVGGTASDEVKAGFNTSQQKLKRSAN